MDHTRNSFFFFLFISSVVTLSLSLSYLLGFLRDITAIRWYWVHNIILIMIINRCSNPLISGSDDGGGLVIAVLVLVVRVIAIISVAPQQRLVIRFGGTLRLLGQIAGHHEDRLDESING